MLVETEELKPKQRTVAARAGRTSSTTGPSRRSRIAASRAGPADPRRKRLHRDVADRQIGRRPGRLENLKELVRSMEEFETLGGFLEHVSLVMDRDTGEAEDAVSIMTLHSAKGLEFDTVFLPGWEEGLFPNQRSLDESGRAGLEEERRLAYVGITRARKRAAHFAGPEPPHPRPLAIGHPLALPRRTAGRGGRGQGHRLVLWRLRLWRPLQRRPLRQVSRDPFDSVYETPRLETRPAPSRPPARSRGPMTIDGDLVARSVDDGRGSAFKTGDTVFHLKFGNGKIAAIEGNKLTIDFEGVGRKKVLESFVRRG